MKHRKRSLLLTLVLLVGLPLFALRLIGEHAFAVNPETYIATPPSTQTDLYKSTQTLLKKDTQKRATYFYPLGDPHQALFSRIVLTEMATLSLDIQYYLFHDDDAGRALLSAILQAAKRGVTVRLLLDDMDTKGRDGLFIRLADSSDNLSIRIFNPSYLRKFRSVEYVARFPRVTRRMHNKSMTADGIAAIVGGRNIGDEYFNIDGEVAFADLDILGAGAVATEVTEQFNDYWHSGLAIDVDRLATPATDDDYEAYLSLLTEAGADFQQRISDILSNDVKDLFAETLQPFYAHSTVIHDQPQKVITALYDTSGSIAPTILALLRSASESLLISSPYLIPGAAGLDVFKELADRGVKVTILTNSLAANDVAAVHAGYRDYRRQLLQLDLELYELKPQGSGHSFSFLGSTQSSLHAKTFTIDEKRSFIGSFNLDPRSAIHNTEMGIVFVNQDYASAVSARIFENMDKVAYKVLLNDQQALEWHETTAEGHTRIHTQEPETTRMQRIVVYLLSWLPVEWLL